MKKIYFIILACIFIQSGFSQSQRFIMFEEFTNASCGPCAAQNPGFDALLNANAAKCTSVKYHTNWPGVDPMNAQNPTDVAARVSYYNVSGVPHALMDGTPQSGSSYLGAPANVTQAKIDSRYAVPSPFSMQFQHRLNTAQDSIFTTMLIQCTQDVASNMVAHNVIIEKWIHFNSPPGSNGEKDFYNVMKKMLPGTSGTAMPASMVVGDYVIFEGAWKLANVYNKAQLAAVGFVQNKVTKEVYQAANSSVNPLNLPYNLDAQVLEVMDVLPKTCINKVIPNIRIRNNGNNMLQSITFKYQVNGGPISSYTWTGGLIPLEKEIVSLPMYEFTIGPENELIVYTTQPNAGTDQYPKNDTLHFTFTNAPVSTNQVKLVLRTDNAPQEITWEIKNSLGVSIANGGPYTEPNKIIQQTITLPQPDCFRFTIHDAGGNGICCANGNGVYELSSNGTIIKQGGQFGYSESGDFWYEAATSTGVEQSVNNFTISPNPVTDEVRVTFNVSQGMPVTLNLFSAVGKLIRKVTVTETSSGSHETTVNCSDLQPGIYIMQLATGSGTYSKKMTVVR